MKVATAFNFMMSHRLRYQALYPILRQIITKQIHFSHMEDILIEKKENTIFGQLPRAAMLFGKFHAGKRKSLSYFLTASARTASKILYIFIPAMFDEKSTKC